MIKQLTFTLLSIGFILNMNGQSSTPNVLFILADDLGVNALGCYGNPYVETPNIDRLAAMGMRFTNGYSNDPTCNPSRASIMTGQYVPRHGIYRVTDRYERQSNTLENMRYLPPPNLRPTGKQVGLDPATITLADAFRDAGYTTGGFGKWGCGSKDLSMGAHGFDEAVETTKHYDFKVYPPQDDILANEYNADYITRKGIDFMQRQVVAEQPFFLYLPYYLVHKPLEPKKEYLEYFQGKYAGQLDFEVIQILAMIKSLDESVGQLLEALEALSVKEETIVVFASDNGHYQTKDNLFNQPYNGTKGETLEGGIRVPYLFSWDQYIAPATVNTAAIIHIDLYPTLLSLTGTPLPEDHPIDGEDLSPILLGQSETLEREELIWQYTNYGGYNAKRDTWRAKWVNVIQVDGFKMTEDVETGTYTLFNLNEDPYETKEIAAELPEKIAMLQQRLEAWKQRTGAVEPKPNPKFVGKPKP
jgi:arylsulfatase A-like enzyme